MPRVLLVDDHRAMQVGIRELLATDFPHLEIEFADTEQAARERLAQGHWDLAIVDINLGATGGLELIARLRELRPHIKVLIYTMHSESHFGVRAFRSGADGYLCKDAPPEALCTAVRLVLSGRKFLSSDLAEQIAGAVAFSPNRAPQDLLSQREYQVLKGLAAGQSLTELANALGVNVKTVSTYRTRLCEKLGAKTQTDLIRFAINHGIVE